LSKLFKKGENKVRENPILKKNENLVIARILNGKSYGEIAREFKVPKVTVKRFVERRGLKSNYVDKSIFNYLKEIYYFLILILFKSKSI
jgi:DNA invertase Pin-like site-specific DNA recombinase